MKIIDLEHASLHMSCPILPKEAPLPSLRQLQTSARDPFYSLTQMMHTGLSHFTGRGLPTIWSFISSSQVEPTAHVPLFSETDSKVIRDWARQLDDWLVQWNSQFYRSKWKFSLTLICRALRSRARQPHDIPAIQSP